ncbi:hypothetical protein KGF57_001308 [Candida theae]|uniref:YMC020W-like alpha/beta hydrolase domain-containing protein n=1 Tax=Candida theae TaxID=1198502 RepID=A0AAD5FZV8_9ASCO|nr:uncharacterized protein KGF57_001308 [Candida theae]KAI5963363.1 hypothetical protein KGF57_001308 [Candida theae]
MDQQTPTSPEANINIRDKHPPAHEASKLIAPPDTETITQLPNSTSRSVLSWLTRSQANHNATSNNVACQDETFQVNGVIAQATPPALTTSTAGDVVVAGPEEPPLPQSSWYSYYTSFIFPSSGESPTMEHIPLLQGNLSTIKDEDEGTSSGSGGWFGWLFGSKQQTQEDEVSDESSEAYKAAKAVVESSKEECHYVYKSSDEFQTFEMSVSGTPTEYLPVLIHTRKHKPVSANEIFEKTLRQKNIVDSEAPSAPCISPKFVDNYREITWKTKTRLITTDFLCGYDTESHLYRKKQGSIVRTRTQLRKIVVISVHNFLPVKLVRALIGEYTGTAIGYGKLATKALRTWLKQNNPEYREDEYTIDCISIDGQGKVATCVADSILLLGNYIKELNECDFIYVVGYGTSSPIAINIMAELLSQNHQLCRKRIGILSMSGNLMGPVPSKFSKIVYRAYTPLENEITREVFEYEKKDSVLSRKLTESVKFLLDQNVKFTFSSTLSPSSFIPLYSSLGSQFDHPNIHRNLYQVNVTPFISSVLDLACQMKNLGVSKDHSIIQIFGDKLDTGKTNKYPFNDEEVYFESLRYFLESTSLHKSKPVQIRKGASGTSNYDLYQLPFYFRGFIQEFSAVKHVNSLQQLKKMIMEYRNWEPTNLNSKDVKYCLEALDEFQIEELFL